jgi:phosphohistidine phosphatase
VHAPLACGFEAADALVLVAAADDEADLLIVGHEPDFSQIVHDLTGARIDMKKGGVACVRLDGSRGELIILLRPRELRAIR